LRSAGPRCNQFEADRDGQRFSRAALRATRISPADAPVTTALLFCVSCVDLVSGLADEWGQIVDLTLDYDRYLK
jgi:cell wall assembly regulator SMI1